MHGHASFDAFFHYKSRDNYIRHLRKKHGLDDDHLRRLNLLRAPRAAQQRRRGYNRQYYVQHRPQLQRAAFYRQHRDQVALQLAQNIPDPVPRPDIPPAPVVTSFPYIMFIHPAARPIVYPDGATMTAGAINTNAQFMKRLLLHIHPDKLQHPHLGPVLAAFAQWGQHGATHGDVMESLGSWKRLPISTRRQQVTADLILI
ncbi:hypothetical protein HDV05_007542 [Chytridiales sp. JEL 0842]|nr:hypothetical protein HDV05_007542 [Chytridiales sp. JEL 0842]